MYISTAKMARVCIYDRAISHWFDDKENIRPENSIWPGDIFFASWFPPVPRAMYYLTHKTEVHTRLWLLLYIPTIRNPRRQQRLRIQ